MHAGAWRSLTRSPSCSLHRVLIDWAGADSFDDDNLQLVGYMSLGRFASNVCAPHVVVRLTPALLGSQSWTAKSVTLDIKDGATVQRFHVPKLYDEITSAKVVKKATRFVVSMRKKDELAWCVAPLPVVARSAQTQH